MCPKKHSRGISAPYPQERPRPINMNTIQYMDFIHIFLFISDRYSYYRSPHRLDTTSDLVTYSKILYYYYKGHRDL